MAKVKVEIQRIDTIIVETEVDESSSELLQKLTNDPSDFIEENLDDLTIRPPEFKVIKYNFN